MSHFAGARIVCEFAHFARTAGNCARFRPRSSLSRALLLAFDWSVRGVSWPVGRAGGEFGAVWLPRTLGLFSPRAGGAEEEATAPFIKRVERGEPTSYGKQSLHKTAHDAKAASNDSKLVPTLAGTGAAESGVRSGFAREQALESALELAPALARAGARCARKYCASAARASGLVLSEPKLELELEFRFEFELELELKFLVEFESQLQV